jgi:catechol 2,3-dioxygenase-like lactoylglutathione lyase family enzyme
MKVQSMAVIRHTRNFDAMVVFYRDKLGMTVTRSWDRADSRGMLLSPGEQTGSTVIELLAMGDLAAAHPGLPANAELSLEIDDVRAWHARLLADGVRIARGLEDTPWGHRSFGVDDPDGLRLWFYQDIGSGEA